MSSICAIFLFGTSPSAGVELQHFSFMASSASDTATLSPLMSTYMKDLEWLSRGLKEFRHIDFGFKIFYFTEGAAGGNSPVSCFPGSSYYDFLRSILIHYCRLQARQLQLPTPLIYYPTKFRSFEQRNPTELSYGIRTQLISSTCG